MGQTLKNVGSWNFNTGQGFLDHVTLQLLSVSEFNSNASNMFKGLTVFKKTCLSDTNFLLCADGKINSCQLVVNHPNLIVVSLRPNAYGDINAYRVQLFTNLFLCFKVSLKGCNCWKNLLPLSKNKNSTYGITADKKRNNWNW